MTITLDMKPESERQLQEDASRAGLEVSEYVRQLVERNLVVPQTSMTDDEWQQLLAGGTIQAPPLTNEQTRREYIYED